MIIKIFLPLVIGLASVIGIGDLIHACVVADTGAIRIVSVDTTCEDGESLLEWGIMGAQGPAGPAGPVGPVGEPGPAGIGDLGCASGQGLLWDDEQGEWTCADAPDNAALQEQITALQAEVDALKALLAGVSREGSTFLISGANLQVVSGSGTTNGEPNGLGNIIIGYNELRNDESDARNGSHMLVVGRENNYSSFGGIVVGIHNDATGDFASVSGGFSNLASGIASSVSGGTGNVANFHYTSVSGGFNNTASGEASSVSGGSSRSAPGKFDWVAGDLP